MVQIKAWTFYLDIYAEDSYKWDRRINIYGAIASSSSIAAWTIWRSWSFIWAAIIAISQVLTAIKQYLPFGRRLKYLQPFIEDMKLLYLKRSMIGIRLQQVNYQKLKLMDCYIHIKRNTQALKVNI